MPNPKPKTSSSAPNDSSAKVAEIAFKRKGGIPESPLLHVPNFGDFAGDVQGSAEALRGFSFWASAGRLAVGLAAVLGGVLDEHFANAWRLVEGQSWWAPPMRGD